MKLIRLRSKLNEIARMQDGQSGGNLDLVVFEAARNAAPKMQGALVHQARLQGVIEVWCHDNNIQYRGYSPSEIKKFATGKGNAGKADVIRAAREKLGYAGNDDNEADALWLLRLAQDEYDHGGSVVAASNREPELFGASKGA
jgi:hypothetical protein